MPLGQDAQRHLGVGLQRPLEVDPVFGFLTLLSQRLGLAGVVSLPAVPPLQLAVGNFDFFPVDLDSLVAVVGVVDLDVLTSWLFVTTVIGLLYRL